MSIYSSSHNLSIFDDHNTSLYKISELIPKKTKTILDIGCSSGYLGQYIKLQTNSNIQFDGIEIDSNDRKIAKKYLDNVKNIDVQNQNKINKITNKYDVIIFADVLEHTINPSKVISNFTKKLNPNGTILISVPNITHQSIILEQLSGQWNYENSGLLDKTHLHFFDFNEIIKIIEENNLYINTIDYSIFDIPQHKISEILNKQGIKNTKEIIILLKKPQHKIFQFIISATTNKPNKYISYIKNIEVLKPISDWINEWEKIWNDISSDKSNKTINQLSIQQLKKIQLLESELNSIKSSKLYKLWPIYNKLKSIVKLITNK